MSIGSGKYDDANLDELTLDDGTKVMTVDSSGNIDIPAGSLTVSGGGITAAGAISNSATLATVRRVFLKFTADADVEANGYVINQEYYTEDGGVTLVAGGVASVARAAEGSINIALDGTWSELLSYSLAFSLTTVVEEAFVSFTPGASPVLNIRTWSTAYAARDPDSDVFHMEIVLKA